MNREFLWSFDFSQKKGKNLKTIHFFKPSIPGLFSAFCISQIPFSQKQQTITENENEQNEEIEYHAKAYVQAEELLYHTMCISRDFPGIMIEFLTSNSTSNFFLSEWKSKCRRNDIPLYQHRRQILPQPSTWPSEHKLWTWSAWASR